MVSVKEELEAAKAAKAAINAILRAPGKSEVLTAQTRLSCRSSKSRKRRFP